VFGIFFLVGGFENRDFEKSEGMADRSKIFDMAEGPTKKKKTRTKATTIECGFCCSVFDPTSPQWDEQWWLHIGGDDESPRRFCSERCFCKCMDETCDCHECGETSWTDDTFFIDETVYCRSCRPACARCNCRFCHDDDVAAELSDGLLLCHSCSDVIYDSWQDALFTAHLSLKRRGLQRDVIPLILAPLQQDFDPSDWFHPI
jgi:hypothetical protein